MIPIPVLAAAAAAAYWWTNRQGAAPVALPAPAAKLSPVQLQSVAVIADEFGKAGLSSRIVAAAVSNAYAESKLNPAAVGDSGHSVGLFQLHDKGAGAGMTREERADARTNAATMAKLAAGRAGKVLRAADKRGAGAAELAQLFSDYLERPKDRAGARAARAAIARQLFPSIA